MIILLTHVVSGVKWGLSVSKGKYLSNPKHFIQSEGVTRSIGDLHGKYLFISCKDANKNGVNSCYWELSGCKWRWRKKACRLISSDYGCEVWRVLCFDSIWEETKVMDNVIKCFRKEIATNKNQMVFKLLLEFASNIHRVYDIDDTRLREIDAKFGDLGLGKRNIKVRFDVPNDEVQFEPKVQIKPELQPEFEKQGPEHEVELMVINKELLNYPSSRPVLIIKLLEFEKQA
nr:hypothetical protein [Tanacetum cinerariifolium]